jgi:hypothetical protein
MNLIWYFDLNSETCLVVYLFNYRFGSIFEISVPISYDWDEFLMRAGQNTIYFIFVLIGYLDVDAELSPPKYNNVI